MEFQIGRHQRGGKVVWENLWGVRSEVEARRIFQEEVKKATEDPYTYAFNYPVELRGIETLVRTEVPDEVYQARAEIIEEIHSLEP